MCLVIYYVCREWEKEYYYYFVCSLFLIFFLSSVDAPYCYSSTPNSASDVAAASIDSTASSTSTIYYAQMGAPVNITCQLDARPATNVTFYWTLNNQISHRLAVRQHPNALLLDQDDDQVEGAGKPGEREMSKEDWHQRTTSGGLLRSVASLVPRSPSDFGTVRCWARNGIGYQAKPCVFHLRQLPSSSSSPSAGQHQEEMKTSTRQERLRTKTSSGGREQTDQQHYHQIDTSDVLITNTGEDEDDGDVREGGEETSLIGTSSSSSKSSGSALSPSSYLASGTVPLERSSNSGNAGRTGDMSHANSHSFSAAEDADEGEEEKWDDERVQEEDVKREKTRNRKPPPLDRKGEKSRKNEVAASPLPSPPHRLLNHLCHRNRTTEELLSGSDAASTSSDGLNCSNTAGKWPILLPLMLIHSTAKCTHSLCLRGRRASRKAL